MFDRLKGVDMMNVLKKQWHRFALVLILLVAGFLSIWGIWNEGYSNEFYAACVKSMTLSWHNFFFVSLDPGGFVTVDKPPVSLWVQAIFARVLGFHGWSMILPECLAAVASVAIIYHIVERHFGKVAGLVSALALALSPIFITVSKTNNMDSVLILFMVLATWAMMVAADKGQLRYLILSVVLLGIAYNAKTLEAFLILPALYATYFFTANIKWRKRVWHLVVATVVLAVISLSWSIIVDLTPASERPYVDNSTNNSELQLALGYNGLQRLTGSMSVGESSTTSGSANSSSTNSTYNANGMGNAKNGQTTEGLEMNGEKSMSLGGSAGSSSGGMFNTGSKGIFRMFSESLGGQDSWLLPFALFAILALILRMRKASGEDADTRRKLLRNLIMWGGSVLTMYVWFSVAGFFHQYYISVLAPGIAALVGIGLVEMWKMYKTDGLTSFVLPLALAVTTAVQILMLTYYPTWAVVMIPLVAVFAGISTLILFAAKIMHKDLSRKMPLICVVICLAGLFITPAVWSYTPILLGVSGGMPSAGPSTSTSSFGGGNMPSGGSKPSGGVPGAQDGQTDGQNGSNGTNSTSSSATNSSDGSKNSFSKGGSGFGSESSSNTKLISFLTKNNTGEKWLVAVPDCSTAESIILATGKPVMALGGFSGNDKILTVSSLSKMVKEGLIKYYMIGGNKGMGSSSDDDVTAWVKAHGTVVSSSLWSNTASSGSTSSNSTSSGLSSSGRAGGFGGESSQVLYDLSSYK